MTNAAGVPAPVAGPGADSGGVKRGGEHLAGSGFRGRLFGGGSMLGYLGVALGGLLLPLRVRAPNVGSGRC